MASSAARAPTPRDPRGIVAQPYLWAGGEFERRGQSERPVERQDKVHQAADLLGDLPLHHEDVAVVLLELPHPGESGERARDLVPMEDIVGVVAKGQLRG